MSSILTNQSALTALQTLGLIDLSLQQTQEAISSGYRINKASDNAAYWSIATTMKSDRQSLSAVQDALGLSSSTLDTAYNGLNNSIDLMTQIRAKLVAAEQPGVDVSKISSEVEQLKGELRSIAQSSSLSGENWLYEGADGQGKPATKQLVASFIRSSSGDISVQSIDFNTAGSILIDDANAADSANNGLLTKVTTVNGHKYALLKPSAGGFGAASEIALASSTTTTTISEWISAVDMMVQGITGAASELGAISARVTNQGNFVKALSDTITKGIGSLVDADMNEESTKLKALQTQQQLGIQALSIANSNAQNILALFR